ncbi:sensor histidine kinase [Hymenobacter crusticola]|uniref:histidine kinase n=1 Tax=Hymenobacter crusticola TaxID=1770526 RepID=A0A243WGM2_9BACT|nr:HAMP domain-containing sensor histidine kinase [Hymenobacter crusticola]OUJ74698.1 hypothetical protein BXP70_08005 [Hymenobacter crusticola]
MKTRIRSIFWLIALCILGINGFQVYWLYNTYELASSQFVRTTNEALRAVVLRQQLQLSRLPYDARPDEKRVTDQHSLKGNPSNQFGALKHSSNDIATRSAANFEKFIIRRIQMLKPGPVPVPTIDLGQLKANYYAELHSRDTEADFVLDTLDLARPTDGYGPKMEAPAEYGLRSQLVPLTMLHPRSGWNVQAAFRTPSFQILRRMGGLLAGSVALLGLTTGCFVLMLNTIFRQKKLADVKNDFINNMTHELKTPLATVSAAVEALQNFGALNDPNRGKAYLKIASNELQRLSDLVEKVLNIAVEERQDLALKLESVHPAELVQELVTHYQMKATKPVHFTVDIAPTDSVLMDRLHVRNVINNVIDNAIKYSGEQEVTIDIRGSHDENGWWLAVHDNGIGIPQSYQPNIFDQFFRVPTGNLHPVKGFGLGLYYVRQVIERHGGQVAVRSAPNSGSEFSLWLPTY